MKIKTAVYVKSAALASQFIEDNLCKIALVGRSNVGKSSFINSLVNRRKLAHTSSSPGKTQTANYYLINDLFYLVDLPGYGYAKRDKTTRAAFGKLIENYLLQFRPQVVMQLIDCRHNPTENDKMMYEWLTYHFYTPYILLTKADKISKNQMNKALKTAKEYFPDTPHSPILYSAQSGQGKEEVLRLLYSLTAANQSNES